MNIHPTASSPRKKKPYQKKPSSFKTAVANMTFSNGYSGGVASKKYIRRIELTQGDKVARRAKVQSCMVKFVYLSKVQVLSTESFGVTKIVVNVVTALLCRQQVRQTPVTVKSLFCSSILSLQWRLSDPSTKPAIKHNFIGLLSQPYFPPRWCKDIPDKCNEDSIDVYCGNVTAAERRRRRSPTMQLSTS